MKRGLHIRRRIPILILLVWASSFVAFPASAFYFQQDTVRQDTTVQRETGQETAEQDSTEVTPYTPSKTPTFRPQYRFGDPFSNRTSQSPLLLNDPSQLDFRVDYDTSGVNYSIFEKLSEVNFRPATSMSFTEFDRYTTSQINRQYWKDRSAGLDGESAVSGRRLIPKLYISPVFDRIFGGSYIDIQPTGFANLDFGGRWQYVDNPQVPQRQRRNGGFNFNMQLSTNVVGKIGEKLAVTFNFDNNNTFDFQNQLKVEYTGYEEDIIKKIEIGNVSMPVQNSLLTGAQSLFGIKTQLQFGKLYVTTIASRQQGRSEVITVGGGQGITNNTSGRGSGQNAGDNINIRASEYDENRHFFLGHYFRDNYEQWHNNLPQINSGVNIPSGSVEVYSINRNNDTRTTRNFLALMDLGESSTEHVFRNGNPLIGSLSGKPQTDNNANELFANLRNLSRDPATLRSTLDAAGMEESTDYVIINTARKLDPSEYIVNEKLGYITLLRRLQNDEVLAVSYQYNAGRENFQVGELQNNYGSRSDDEAIILKMLRPNQIETQIPTWDLMMKNVYNLRTTQVQEEGFSLRVHYRDDRTGQDNPSLHLGRRTKDQPLIELMGLDQLNRNGDRQRDGNFDFVPGVTIDTRNGNIIFPVLEPFGSNLASFFDPDEASLVEQFVYDTLYRTTKANAELVSALNKYVLLGSSSGSISNIIPLNGFNIAPGSVTVTAGGTLLTEGLHYDVDYNLGQVRIRDDAILQSGKSISVAYEKADLFNFQTRWLTGAHFDYRINDNFNIGATVLRLNERPGGISRFAIGDEPTRNTKYGFNINWQDESIFLTKLVDALPLVSTKEPSNITFSAEVAQLVPGTSNIVQGTGTSYIDDFENATTPINLGTWPAWRLAATPRDRFGDFTGRELNFNRAKLAWYTIDNSIFYRAIGNNRPDNITEDDLRNHYVRLVLPQEIFTQRDRTLVTTNEPIFDVAFFPEERGPYNFNPMARASSDDHAEFLLPSATQRENWGGISRAITTNVDFIATNVEYLEFWLLDPFIEGQFGVVQDGSNDPTNNNSGGDLYFNLGSISEDLMRDGRHAFENGLPEDGNPENTTTSEWGRVTNSQFLTNAFVNDGAARANQDIGLDGLTDEAERDGTNYSVGPPPSIFTGPNVEDPAGDNFQYYLGGNLDARDAKILERYKNFNGLEGNSPVSSGGSFTPASTQFPDNEDLNNDNTISDLEEYYEYRIPLRPGELQVGSNHIVDQVSTFEGTNWYLFRIPIQNPQNYRVVGTPTFNNIKYVRMYLTNFSEPVVLRMAKFQLVGSQWRKSTLALNELGLNEVPETVTSDFDVSVVNIEDNGGPGEGIPYVIPPGLNRDRDNTTALNRRVSEQSLQLCIEDLADRDARAVYKTNLNYDLINYGRIKMFLHAQAYQNSFVQDDELEGFLRLGSDENENFYEIAVPLKITPGLLDDVGEDNLRRAVWPLENEIDVSINEILGLKSERNRVRMNEGAEIPYSQPSNDGKFQLTVKGNPDISSITTMLIGVRNPGSEDRESHSVCLWANELRVTDFDTRKGWAANARLSVKLADLGTVSASTRYTSIGYGTIQQKISERTRAESIQYDVSTSLNVDKFLWPEKTGLKIPMFASYEQSRITPQFDPLDPDTPLEASLESFNTQEERNEYRRLVEDRRTSRSLNFTNVRKQKVNPDAGSNIYDIENFTFSYAYSDIVSSSVSQQSFIQKTVSGGVSYNYSPPSFSIEPFSKAKWLENPYLKLIKDINFSPLPSNLSFRADLNRSFRQTQLYNDQLTIEGVDPFYERLFTFARSYNLRWSLFKGLSFDYSARANAVIDEPDDRIDGDIDTRVERQFIWDQITSFGRMKNFQQDVSANYKLPLDKFPITDWMSADYRYSVGYNWTAGFVNRQDGFSNAPPDADDPDFFGNFISNNRSQALTGKFDLVKLYNKVGYLKKVNASSRSGNSSRSRARNSRRVQNDNEEEEEAKGSNKVVNGFVRLLMSLRSINVTYNVRESTTLPGFLPNLYLFGLDSGFNAPGWEFLLGSQNASIKRRAANSGWLTRNPALTNPFEQTLTNDLTISANLEPFQDFKIKLDAKRTNNSNYQEIFSFDTLSSSFQAFSPSRGGSYNISFLSINTAFESQSNNGSEAFDQFAQNIGIMRARLNQQAENAGIDAVYDTLSQDVLVPAFLAAYSKQDANTANTSPLPKIPIPNWRLDYAGLSKLPGLSDIFSSINVTHGYRSVYSISNYTNNILYNQGVSLEENILDYPLATLTDENTGNLIPVYNIQQVTIAEQFTPLIGINVRTKTNFTSRFELKRDRNLSLNVSNAQITETRNNEVSFDLGYVKDKLKLPWKSRGRTITIENEVTFRMNMSIRNALTIQRNLEGENTVTNGNKNFQMRPTIGYRLNDQLDLTMYFERTITNPQVGSFRRATTAFGIQTRLNFAQ